MLCVWRGGVCVCLEGVCAVCVYVEGVCAVCAVCVGVCVCVCVCVSVDKALLAEIWGDKDPSVRASF